MWNFIFTTKPLVHWAILFNLITKLVDLSEVLNDDIVDPRYSIVDRADSSKDRREEFRWPLKKICMYTISLPLLFTPSFELIPALSLLTRTSVDLSDDNTGLEGHQLNQMIKLNLERLSGTLVTYNYYFYQQTIQYQDGGVYHQSKQYISDWRNSGGTANQMPYYRRRHILFSSV